MRAPYLVLGLCFILSCGGNAPPPVAESSKMMVLDAPQPSPPPAPAPVPVPKIKKGKIKYTQPKPEPRPAMDTLEVETDTSEWVLGKVAVITVIIAEPELLLVTNPTEKDVDIGLDYVPVSAYYLVALEGGQQGQFEILPAPGQQEKQHRAPKGYPATWRYEVTPLKRGKMDLLFTLKVYAEGASAGTSISTRPLHLDVQTHFPKSYLFRTNYWINHNGGWGPVFGVLAAALTALAYTEWWRRKRRLRNPKTPPTSEPES